MIESGDRFAKIATDYATLWNEVVKEAGFDYQTFQRSIFEAALELPNLKNCRILDLGIGDGETSKFFIDHGCEDITGVDLNPEMLNASRSKFGDRVKLVQADISRLEQLFSFGSFDLIISGTTIHNIPKSTRALVWQQIKNLNSRLFISGDKIADDDPAKHIEYLQRETRAIEKIYKERHGLKDMAEEWLQHYDADEREKLYTQEMQDALAPEYQVSVVGEFGMYKTVKARLNDLR